MVARAVVLEGRGPKLAGEIRRDERAARLVRAGDQPHRQPSAFALEIEVQTERADGPPAAAWLLRVEEAEEHPRAGVRRGDGKASRRREFVVERLDGNPVRVGRRRGG